VIESIPPGRWTTYGVVAWVASTGSQVVGNRIASGSQSGAWRVLRTNGEIAPGFKWPAGSQYLGMDPRQVLEAEGVEFESNGLASEVYRIAVEELTSLFENQSEM